MATITKTELLNERGDLSQFLFHLTRSGDFKRDKDIYSLTEDEFIQITAKDSLKEIVQNKRIEARSAFGYFNYKVPLKRATGTLNENSHVRRDWLRAVCFTETPLDHVKLQMKTILGRQLHFEPYGLAFREEVVRNANGNPIFYVQTTNKSIRDAFDKLAESSLATNFKPFMPLVDGFGPPWFQRYGGPQEVDFRWEREWRVVGDFSFTFSDVAFGLCPKKEIKDFEEIFDGDVPFIDPLEKLEDNKKKLRQYNHLKDLK